MSLSSHGSANACSQLCSASMPEQQALIWPMSSCLCHFDQHSLYSCQHLLELYWDHGQKLGPALAVDR
jgi:hypothetical protein